MLVKDIGELDLIERIRRLIENKQERAADVIVSLGDDAAVVTSEGNSYIVLTTDSLIEDVHFTLKTSTGYALGYKSMSIGVSDIAAMAALPKYALVSLGLKPQTEVKLVEDFYYGLIDAASQNGLKILGGDITSALSFTVTLTVVGFVEPPFLRKRCEAQLGDVIMVTGYLGASSAGLALLQDRSLKRKVKEADLLIKAHQFPTPRVNEARVASRWGAHAMEDISDGLASELLHICQESRVGAEIKLDLLPLAKGVEKVAKLTEKKITDFVLYGGEDYELVFTASRADASRIKTEIESKTSTAVSIIGEILPADERITFINSKGKRIELIHHGYEHFT